MSPIDQKLSFSPHRTMRDESMPMSRRQMSAASSSSLKTVIHIRSRARPISRVRNSHANEIASRLK